MVSQWDRNDTFTEELRAVSLSNQRFRWTTGAYYRSGGGTSEATSIAYVPLLSGTVPINDFKTKVYFGTYPLAKPSSISSRI